MARERKPRARKIADAPATVAPVVPAVAAAEPVTAMPALSSVLRNALRGKLAVAGRLLSPGETFELSDAEAADSRIQHAIKIGVLVKV